MRHATRTTLASAALVTAIAAAGAQAQLTLEGAQLLQQGVGGMPDSSEWWDELGWALAAGDFDGDLVDDLVISAMTESLPGIDAAGQITVVYGQAAGLDPASGATFSLADTAFGPPETLDLFGFALAVGRFDDDELDDVAIGIPYRSADVGGGTAPRAGAVLVLHGSGTGLGLAGHQLWQQGSGGMEGVPEEDDELGSALAAGDFNGDGRDDLAIGVPWEDVGALENAGAVNVVYGSPAGLSTGFAPIDDQIWTQGAIGLTPSEEGDTFGRALAVGNFNGDAFDDLAIAAPWEDAGTVGNAGAVTILYGTGLGLSATGAKLLTQDGPVPGGIDLGDSFGWSLAAGDFDCDGIDDLAVGIPYEDLTGGGGVANVGAAVVLRGSPTGILEDGGYFLDRGDAVGPHGASDRFAAALAAGDFDADGCADLVFGAPGAEVDGVEDAGTAFVFRGRPGAAPLFAFEASQAGPVPGLPETDDRLGEAFAVGDFDADGDDDLAVGVPGDSAGGQEDAGQVNVFYGDGALLSDGFETGDFSQWSSVIGN